MAFIVVSTFVTDTCTVLVALLIVVGTLLVTDPLRRFPPSLWAIAAMVCVFKCKTWCRFFRVLCSYTHAVAVGRIDTGEF